MLSGILKSLQCKTVFYQHRKKLVKGSILKLSRAFLTRNFSTRILHSYYTVPRVIKVSTVPREKRDCEHCELHGNTKVIEHNWPLKSYQKHEEY